MPASHLIRLSTLLILTAACVESRQPGGPTSPLPVSPPAPPAAPPVFNPPVPFPDLSRAGQIYVETQPLYDFRRFNGTWAVSRYVLYADSVFSLQFSSSQSGFFEYLGHYSREGSSLTFAFDADSQWTASASMRGDSLSVQYSQWAVLSDFSDGVYVRQAH